MQYLLDTHVILWWLTDPKILSKKSRLIISNRENKLFVSSASLWEMSIKANLGRLKLPSNILSVIKEDAIQLLDISPNNALGIADLPTHHKDPFDHMLVIQAKQHDLILITRDKALQKYPIMTLAA